MTYKTIVSKIYVSPHPNADRLQVGHICGFRVVVGLDAKDGDLYCFFPDDGQLSTEFATAHDLIRRKDADGKQAGGFFEEKRRVRAQPFRGVKSEGFAVPLDWMAFTGYDTSKLKEGDQFDTLNGVPICNKYFTKATLAAMQGNKKKNSLKAAFPEHWETTQYRFAHLDAGDLVVITEKEHGTSVRYGYVEVAREKNWFEKLVAKVGYYTRSKTEKFSMEYLLGTRRTILAKKKQIAFNKKDFWVTNHNDEFEFVGGFYGDGEPYKLAAIKLNGKLKDSEIVYGELVGYCTNGSPLFTHSLVKLPDLEKTYGSPMVYSYGCVPGNGRLRVYRITHNGRDLSWFEKVKRCKELGVEMVTEMGRFVYDGNKDALDARIQSMLEGPSLIDGTHMREGVCIWVENEHGIKVYKEKSYSFKLAEGIVKENDSYVDAEEAA